MDQERHRHLRTAVDAAERGGDVLEAHFSPPEEPGGNDAEAASRAAEETIIDCLSAAYPEHQIIAEESAPSFATKPRWIVDPLDGSGNFDNGFEHFSVSIAFEGTTRPDVGVVYHVPSDRLYTAVRGEGAYVDGRRLRLEGPSDLSEAFVVTGFDADSIGTMEFEHFRTVLRETAGLRRTGTAAAELALVAAGTFDVFFERMLDVWDTSAGALLVTEAGGEVTRIEAPDGVSGEMILASPEAIHRDVVALVSTGAAPSR